VIVGPRSAANGEVEVKDRKTGERQVMTSEAALNRIAG
jgi:prolyl-tRNA synthetase